jgi:tetratricopeptide (TPR) repeat protein
LSSRKILYRKKKRNLRAILLVVALFLAAVFYFYTGGAGTGNIKAKLKELFYAEPVFKYITVEHNGVKKNFSDGQIISIYPYDSFKILKTATTTLFNRGIRLFSKGFDVNALQEGVAIEKLLPNRDIFHRYVFNIEIKHRNKKIGEVGLVISPSVEDWLERASRIVDNNKRLDFLRMAIREQKDSFRLKMKLADECLALKKWKEGAEIIEDLVKDREDLDLMNKLVDVYDHLRSYDNLINTLRKILAKAPEDLELRVRLIGYLEKTGRSKEAVKEYMSIMSELPEDEKIASMKNIGYLLFQSGQKKEALQWYLKAAGYDTKDPNLYYNIGSIYGELNKRDLAEKYLRLAVDLKKDDVEGRSRLAQSLFNKGKTKEAKIYVEEILGRNPNDLDSLVLLAAILEKEGDSEALKETYGRILSINPKNTTIMFNLAMLESEKGDVKKALRYFNRLLELNPKDVQVGEALFDVYQKEKMNDLAFKQSLALIKLVPKKIFYYTFIFEYLAERSEFGKLSEYMSKGVKANPKNFELRQYLILSYLKLKKNDLAIKEMEEALKLMPDNTDLLHQLARLKEDTGDLNRALRLYKNILEVSPGDEKAEENFLRLRLKLLHEGQ